ncbi:hypothetical protein AAVH_11604 [Aphelenchoides avenae]|nr:hypothetical protein AAVH_11604 [Aphelenchus avenae]
MFDQATFVMMTKSEFNSFENVTLKIVYGLCSKRLINFGLTDAKVRKSILKCLTQRISLLHMVYLSAQMFPQLGDKRLALHYGFYIDGDCRQYMFKEQADPAKFVEMSNQTYTSHFTATEKFRRLRLTQLEVAALAGVICWNEIESRCQMTPELEHHRDQMLAELHAHLTATYGTVNGGIRLARVVSLCHDVGAFYSALTDLATIMRVFGGETMEDVAETDSGDDDLRELYVKF